MSRDIVEVSSGGQWEGCVGALSRYSVYDSEVFGDAGLPPVQDLDRFKMVAHQSPQKRRLWPDFLSLAMQDDD